MGGIGQKRWDIMDVRIGEHALATVAFDADKGSMKCSNFGQNCKRIHVIEDGTLWSKLTSSQTVT